MDHKHISQIQVEIERTIAGDNPVPPFNIHIGPYLLTMFDTPIGCAMRLENGGEVEVSSSDETPLDTALAFRHAFDDYIKNPPMPYEMEGLLSNIEKSRVLPPFGATIDGEHLDFTQKGLIKFLRLRSSDGNPLIFSSNTDLSALVEGFKEKYKQHISERYTEDHSEYDDLINYLNRDKEVNADEQMNNKQNS